MAHHRRWFLKTGLTAGASALLQRATFGAAPRAVTLVVDPSDPIASAAPAARAIGELEGALCDAGVDVRRATRVGDAPTGDRVIVVTRHTAAGAMSAMRGAGVALGDGPERLALVGGRVEGRDAVVACATDALGLRYALSELAERVRGGADP